ncbi:MAG: restriction endonuclease subunit S [Christensenellaceae bacterium]|jgi:type I restriction enzyme S subunit|nr:restriction endonuclease subunit S [Christensenellaceae bacterium]
MHKSNFRTPKRRFKQFKNATGWKQQKLEDIATFNPQSILPDKFEYIDLTSVTGTSILSHRTVEKALAPKSARLLASSGDIFYQLVRPYQRNNYLYNLPYDNYVFSNGYAQIRPNIDSYFLFNLLQNDQFLNVVIDRCTGSCYPVINPRNLRNIEVSAPQNINEQIKIGRFLEKIDKLISVQQSKLDKFVALKKAYLCEMFPVSGECNPKRRFAGFTDAWKEQKLGDVADIICGGTPRTNVQHYWDGDINWFVQSDIRSQIYLYESKKKITQLGLKESAAKILPVGTVLFASVGAGLGNMAILAKSGTTNQGFQSITPHDNYLDSYFIFSRKEELKQYTKTIATATTFPQVTGKQMEVMPIRVPSLDEQHKIGKLFQSLDNNITIQQSNLEKLQRIKQSYLNEMLV